MTSYLHSVRSVFRDSLTVADLVRHQRLYAVQGSQPAMEAAIELAELGYDRAPVLDSPMSLYVLRRELEEAPGDARSVAHAVGNELLIPETTPIDEAMDRLRGQPYMFATHRRHVTGVVNHADLGQPVVALLLFGVITEMERFFDEIIIREHGDNWPLLLSDERRRGVDQVYEIRQKKNIELNKTAALNLDDRVSLLRKSDESVCKALGFESKGRFSDWAEAAKEVRNSLAHGSGLLGAVPDPIKALDAFDGIVDVAEKARTIVSSRYD